MKNRDHNFADDLDSVAVGEALGTQWLGRPCYFHRVIDSTNAEALRLAQAGADVGTMIIAEEQTHGRGRAGRSWSSPPGLNLYFSLIVKTAWQEGQTPPPLSLAAGVGLARGLNSYLPASAALKWPNDVLVFGKKLAGILVEIIPPRNASAESKNPQRAVVGIGVNVNITDFPAELWPIATSLRLASGTPQSRVAVLNSALTELESVFEQVDGGKTDSVLRAWSEHAASWLGREVRVRTGTGTVDGTALGIDDSGALRLKRPGGDEILVHAGDVELS